MDLETGTEVPMGAPFDTFAPEAHTANAQGRVRRYREILVRVMGREGVVALQLSGREGSGIRPGDPVKHVIVVAAVLASAAAARAQTGSPAGEVPVERLSARRVALLDSIGTGVAVVGSGRVRDIEHDYPQDSDYREENDFFYLTGLESPESWLVLLARQNGPDELVLFISPAEARAERWTGRSGAREDAARVSGIRDVRAPEEIGGAIESLALGPGSPARRGGLHLLRDQRGDDPLIRRLVASAAQLQPVVTVGELGGRMAQLRLVKDADEIGRLRRAIAITGEALLEAIANARPGVYEYELEARIEYVFRRRGSERLGFPSIVGSGPNGTTLHYDRNRRQTRVGDLVVMDVGAEYGYLTADITRTIPISGRFSTRQRALYELVLGSQQAALAQVRPGVTLPMLDRIARNYLRDHSGSLCGPISCDRYFVHGLSHWLGMDVHDVGSYSTPLAPGMVFTIEPGIYLREEGLGIRIEDDVLVTAKGHELLSTAVPRSADAIERTMVGTR